MTLNRLESCSPAPGQRGDVLIFGADERGPDGDLRLQFEAISKFAPEEKKVIKALLESIDPQIRSQTLVVGGLNSTRALIPFIAG